MQTSVKAHIGWNGKEWHGMALVDNVEEKTQIEMFPYN